MIEPTLSDEKWVRVMCDYCTDGIWAKDGAAVGHDELPVSQGIKDRLTAWQAWHDTRDGEPWEQFRADRAFAAEGLSIAQAIKSELPDWTVLYFDEAKCRYGQVGQDRAEFEYEITL